MKEYEVIYEDLRDVIADFISSYTQPEKLRATYIHDGNEISVERKAAEGRFLYWSTLRYPAGREGIHIRWYNPDRHRY